jgi:hypothetical protein
MVPSQSCSLVSLPPDATVQQQPQLSTFAKAVPNGLDLLDQQVDGGLLWQVLAMRRQAGP